MPVSAGLTLSISIRKKSFHISQKNKMNSPVLVYLSVPAVQKDGGVFGISFPAAAFVLAASSLSKFMIFSEERTAIWVALAKLSTGDRQLKAGPIWFYLK